MLGRLEDPVNEREHLRLVETNISADERTLRKVAFHAILKGETMDRAGLAALTGFAPEHVAALLDGLVDRGLIVLDSDGRHVVGSWGLSLMPTDHQLRIRGHELHTWCAVDAVGIPAGLNEDARIASQCHRCGAPVRVEMSAGQVARAEPAGAQVWMTAGQVGRSMVGST
jgi:hypothetical protein